MIHVVRSLAFLGQTESPEANTENRPHWFMTTCKTSLFSCLQNHRNFLFHNYLCMSTHSIWWSQINGGQWPSCSLGGTPSLPHSVAPPIKPPTHSSQAAALWTQRRQPSSLCFNKSFFSTHGMVFVWQFLTSGTKTLERLAGCSRLGLVPWPLCPAICWTQTA
jgi:hypothetical protein